MLAVADESHISSSSAVHSASMHRSMDDLSGKHIGNFPCCAVMLQQLDCTGAWLVGADVGAMLGANVGLVVGAEESGNGLQLSR